MRRRRLPWQWRQSIGARESRKSQNSASIFVAVFLWEQRMERKRDACQIGFGRCRRQSADPLPNASRWCIAPRALYKHNDPDRSDLFHWFRLTFSNLILWPLDECDVVNMIWVHCNYRKSPKTFGIYIKYCISIFGIVICWLSTGELARLRWTSTFDVVCTDSILIVLKVGFINN